jgi:peptidyl-prolyl cis-trans isomerase SurA
MNRKLISICTALAALFFATAIARAEIVNRIAAIVDDEVITVHEIEVKSAQIINAYLAQAKEELPEQREQRIQKIRKDTLRALIERKLLETEVARLGIPVEEQDIDSRIQSILSANQLTREQLNQTLLRDGITMKEFRDEIRNSILTDQYVGIRMKDRVKVSEEEALSYYQLHLNDYIADIRITLAEIRFNLPAAADEETIRQVFDEAASTYEALLAGADFEQTAREGSDGSTAKNGGVLGQFLLESQLKKTYKRAAENLESGQVSTVFRDTAGFFILKCLDRTNDGSKPFEEVRERIMIQLRNEASQREMQKLAKELYKKSYVDIKIDEFN